MVKPIYSLLFALSLLVLVLTSCKSTGKSSSVKSTKTEKSDVSATSKEEKVINTARSYIGTRYKMGGTTRAGMDCSGLMYTCWKSVNMQLPRTSEEQSKLGTTVRLSDLRPGDLVFFTDRKGRKKVTHVGMITRVSGDKNVKFIHASTKLGVVESDLYADYYISVFLFAKRIR